MINKKAILVIVAIFLLLSIFTSKKQFTFQQPWMTDDFLRAMLNCRDYNGKPLLNYAVSDDSCILDSDCFPASCCHPTEAVNMENKTDCTGVICTSECRSNTIDCGNGFIKCLDGVCTAWVSESGLKCEKGIDICEYPELMQGLCIFNSYESFSIDKDDYIDGLIIFDTFISSANGWLA